MDGGELWHLASADNSNFPFQNRSFVFGASAAPPQQQAQVQDNKPAFNFNAGMTPNFNFGGQGNAPAPQQVRWGIFREREREVCRR